MLITDSGGFLCFCHVNILSNYQFSRKYTVFEHWIHCEQYVQNPPVWVEGGRPRKNGICDDQLRENCAGSNIERRPSAHVRQPMGILAEHTCVCSLTGYIHTRALSLGIFKHVLSPTTRVGTGSVDNKRTAAQVLSHKSGHREISAEKLDVNNVLEIEPKK